MGTNPKGSTYNARRIEGGRRRAVQSGNLLFLSGVLPTEGQGAKYIGRVGAGRCFGVAARRLR